MSQPFFFLSLAFPKGKAEPFRHGKPCHLPYKWRLNPSVTASRATSPESGGLCLVDLLFLKLQHIEVIVSATELQKLIVVALLHYFAVG